MAIYAAIFPPGDGEYEERPRDPYARGHQHKEPPQFTWERFPVHILFCLSRLFSTFRFSFFHPSSTPSSLSLSLQSSTLNPSPFFPPLLWFFHPPLRSRRSFYLWWIAVELPVALAGPMEQQPLRGEKTEGGDEGTSGGGETVNHPVDICARITRKARDSFEAIFPTSAQLLYSYSSSSRDSMSRGRKKGLKGSNETRYVSNYDNASGELYHSARNILRNFKFDGVNKIEARSRLKEIIKF